MVESNLIESTPLIKGAPNKQQVLDALQDVKDPEIPTISVVDLGIITAVDINTELQSVKVTMTPTFVGCPALDYIQREVLEKAQSITTYAVEVVVDYSTPWSTNLVTERGMEALHKHGLALPPRFSGEFEPEILLNAVCPFCSSTNTRLQSPFGPTLCRALYYCQSCLQGFEQFKPA